MLNACFFFLFSLLPESNDLGPKLFQSSKFIHDMDPQGYGQHACYKYNSKYTLEGDYSSCHYTRSPTLAEHLDICLMCVHLSCECIK